MARPRKKSSKTPAPTASFSLPRRLPDESMESYIARSMEHNMRYITANILKDIGHAPQITKGFVDKILANQKLPYALHTQEFRTPAQVEAGRSEILSLMSQGHMSPALAKSAMEAISIQGDRLVADQMKNILAHVQKLREQRAKPFTINGDLVEDADVLQPPVSDFDPLGDAPVEVEDMRVDPIDGTPQEAPKWLRSKEDRKAGNGKDLAEVTVSLQGEE